MSRRRRTLRISREWLYLRLIEYMIYNQTKQGFTKYELTNKVPNLPAQRQDRISDIIDRMLEIKHLEVVFEAPTATYYNITEEGKKWYADFGKRFQRFSEFVRR